MRVCVCVCVYIWGGESFHCCASSLSHLEKFITATVFAVQPRSVGRRRLKIQISFFLFLSLLLLLLFPRGFHVCRNVKLWAVVRIFPSSLLRMKMFFGVSLFLFSCGMKWTSNPRESWNPPLDRLLEAKMSYWRNDPNVLLKIKIQVRHKKTTTTSILFYSSIFNSPYFFFLFSVGIKKLKFSFIPPKENNAVRKRGAQTMGRFFSHRFFVLSRLCFSSLRRRRRWERRMRAGHPNPKYAYRVVVGGRAGRMGLRTLGHLIT